MLIAQGGDPVAHATVTQPANGAAAAHVGVFVPGYLCELTTGLTASLESLKSATLTGKRLPVTCVYQPDPEIDQTVSMPDVTGTVSVELAWQGVGEVARIPLNGNLDHCVGRFLERSAELSGKLTISVPGLGIEETLTAADGQDTRLAYDHNTCPPRR
ncbi:MAG: hypothetical protein M3Q47_00770 [Actinomycetota bacterium]|nr:hypothetical protein [Actinomycetota bacterium]